MRFLALIQYRAAAAAGVCTQWVFGMMKVLALYAFYRSSNAAQPMSFQQAATYVWIGQAMLATQPWGVDSEIASSVLTGQVAYELTRPLDLYSMWFARTLALRTAPALLRAVPQFAVALLIVPAPYGMLAPTPGGLAAWAAAMLCAVVLSSAITNFMHALILWTVRGEGVIRFMPALVMFSSGMVVPMRLLPDWFQTFARLQPFAGLMDLPSQLFCGSLAPGNALWIVGTQVFWIAVFVLGGRRLISSGLRRVTVAGG